MPVSLPRETLGQVERDVSLGRNLAINSMHIREDICKKVQEIRQIPIKLQGALHIAVGSATLKAFLLTVYKIMHLYLKVMQSHRSILSNRIT